MMTRANGCFRILALQKEVVSLMITSPLNRKHECIWFPLLFPFIISTDICPISNCSISRFKIKFPFYTASDSEWCLFCSASDCSNPGFKLSCTKQGLTSINLPYSGEFLVRDINYRTQEIEIYNTKSCLAKRLQSFNLSDSVFNSPYYVELIFLTCTANLTKSNYRVIDCLSNSKNSTMATTSLEYAKSLRYLCEISGMFNIPIWRSGPYDDYIINRVFGNNIILRWDKPNCMACEAMGVECRFDDHHNKVACFDPEKGKLKTIAKLVALCITIPAICIIICGFLSLCNVCPTNNTIEEITIIQPSITTPPPTRGLDDSTIATYQQVTLGESKRFSGSGDRTCVICLSEFCAKDTLKIIPECNHCFHTTCIDEWLRMRGSCPVCRNSLCPAHENVERGYF